MYSKNIRRLFNVLLLVIKSEVNMSIRMIINFKKETENGKYSWVCGKIEPFMYCFILYMVVCVC